MTPAIAAAGFEGVGAVSFGRSGDAASGSGEEIEGACGGLEGSAGGGDGSGG